MFLGLQVTVFRFDPGGDTIQPLITRRIPNFPSIVFTVYTVRLLIPGWLYLPTGGYLSCESLQLFSEARRYLDCAGSRELEKGWHSFKDEIPGTSTALQARAPARLCKLSFRGNARTALQRSAAWARNAWCSSNPSSQRPASHCSGHCRRSSTANRHK